MIAFNALWKVLILALLAAGIMFLVAHVGRSVKAELGRFAKMEVGK